LTQVAASQAPDSVSLAPAVESQAPASVESAQVVESQAPASVELAPAVESQASASVELAPEAASPAPASVELAPEAASPAPASVELAPEGASPAPDSVELAPEGASQAPVSVELAQEGVGQVTEAVNLDKEERVELGKHPLTTPLAPTDALFEPKETLTWDVKNDDDFYKDHPVIYIKAKIINETTNGNDDELAKIKTEIVNVINDFEDIYSPDKNYTIEQKYKFFPEFIISQANSNEFLSKKLNLRVEITQKSAIKVTGLPGEPFDGPIVFKLRYSVTFADRIVRLKTEFKKDLYIASDPRDLWKNLPVNEEDFEGYVYPNESSDSVKIADINKVLTVACLRGRSHAHVGKPRDDNYKFSCNLESGWNVVAVADGAGSSRFSRKGSDLACSAVVEVFEKVFGNAEHLTQIESEIKKFHDKVKHFEKNNVVSNDITLNKADKSAISLPDDQAKELPKMVSDEPLDDKLNDRPDSALLNNLFHQIVLRAGAAIKNEYEIKRDSDDKYKDIKISAYHTTLLFMAFKKFDFGYFFGSFWIGDGAMVLYNLDEKGVVKVLGVPDSGEYAGETRFLTMSGELNEEKVMKRTVFTFADSFEAIILATDGITDPFFPSENETLSPERWKHFWNETLRKGDNENAGCPEIFDPQAPLEAKANALLKWLNFWSKGNHDDRTLMIIN
jgi:serine/threonine protein phosphatase PrpC